LPERLASVLEAIYLVFNEGYAASAGDDWMRPALCAEALRLARILAHRMPVPPVLGLLALMELQASRAAARVDAQGAPILLDQQNRARWDWLQIERGQQALARAVSAGGGDDPYVLQARIAFCHASARRAEDTDWARIAALYAQLLQVMPSPVVALNRVVAVSRSEGAFAAWALLQPLLDEPRLQGYAPLMVVRGELLQQLGREQDARDAFASAAALSQNQAERTLLRQRAGLPQEN
jgi:predicted RNA polymerase sigma factor